MGITVAGATLHVEDTGGSGEPVLFLHGFLFDGRQWDAPVELLRDRYRCVTVDLPGQGRSQPSRHGYGIDTLTRDVVAVIEQLDAGPVHLVGLSMGGFIGMRVAARRPELVRSLTLVNTSAGPHARTKFPKQLALAAVARVTGVSLPPIVAGTEGEMYGADFRDDPASEGARQVWRERWASVDRGALVATLLGIMLRSDFRDHLGEITAASLVIAGGQDASLPPAQSREIVDQLPGARLVVLPRAGHSSPIEDPEGFTGALSDFLANVGAATQ